MAAVRLFDGERRAGRLGIIQALEVDQKAGLDAGARALAAYDRWVGLMAQPDVRTELETLTFATRDTSTLYAEIREIGREFEDGLGALLFSSSLGRLTRTYAIF